jgi:DNA-binding NtrC family response regulator
MRTILIVDDMPEILQFLRRTFSGASYEVTTAPDGESAITCLTKPFDVVLADMNMPGMTGCELAKWVAEHWPATRTVLMSGHELPCDACPYSPRCTFIRKPFRLEEIVAAVERASGEQRDAT